MELHQLNCFTKTAELGSFTKAAAQLQISQPALSKNIHLLEERLGVKLFDRQGQKVTLNDTGRMVLTHAGEILKHCDEIQGICQSAKHPEKETITLRMTAGSEYLPEILAGFQHLHPSVSIISLQNSSEEADTEDISVFASVHASNTRYRRSVLQESLALAVPPGHPLFDREQISFREIAQFPIISLRTGNDMRAIEDHYFHHAGVEPRRIVECDAPATLRALIKRGFGIAVVPTVTWRFVLDSGLRLIPVQDRACIRYINVSFTDPERITDTSWAFYEYIVSFFTSRNSGGINSEGISLTTKPLHGKAW